MIAEIRHPQTVDSPHNLAHRDDCPLGPRGRSVKVVLEDGANFLTLAPGEDQDGRTVHLTPCETCIGPLDEPVDRQHPDLGTKGKYPAGPFNGEFETPDLKP